MNNVNINISLNESHFVNLRGQPLLKYIIDSFSQSTINKLYHLKYYLIIDENLLNQYKAIIDTIIKEIQSTTVINGNMEVGINDITLNIYGQALDFPADINWVYDSIIYFKKYGISTAQYRTGNNQLINVIYSGTRYIKSQYTHEYYVNNTLRKEYEYDTNSNSKRTGKNCFNPIHPATITGWSRPRS